MFYRFLQGCPRLSLLPLLGLLAAPAGAAVVTWDFLPGGSDVQVAGYGYRNEVNFLQDERLLAASAYIVNSRWERFSQAHLGLHDGGLGACNREESTRCHRDSGEFAVDNTGDREWLLLELDDEYSFESVQLATATSSDAGLSFWIGSISTGESLNRRRYTDLSGLGFTVRQDATVSGGTTMLELGGTPGNALLIGGSAAGATDAFYLQRLEAGNAVVPLPPSVLAFGSALALLGFLRLRQAGAL